MTPPISADEAAVLARYAGIPAAADRLPVLTAEFAAIAALIADLETVDVASVPAVAPAFDAAWSGMEGGES